MALLLVVVALLPVAHGALLPPALSTVPLEAESAAAMVIGALPQRGRTLFLDADDTPWVDAFLQRLPPEAPRALLPANYSWKGSLHRHAQTNSDLIMLARAHTEDLLRALPGLVRLPKFSFVVMVTSAASIQAAIEQLKDKWICGYIGFLLVVTPDGVASLVSLGVERCDDPFSDRGFRLFNHWVPSLRRWKVSDNVIPGYCSKPLRSTPLMLLEPGGSYHAFQMALVAAKLSGFQVHTATSSASWKDDFQKCGSDAYRSKLAIVPLPPRDIDGFYLTQLSTAAIVVPSGIGPQHFYLQAVVNEFPPVMWGMTLLGTLLMALTLVFVEGHADQAPLRALAPLLAQAPPGRAARHPLFLAWLLVSVVLVAAYQGLLLKMLEKPILGELKNIEDVLASGLTIAAPFSTYHQVKDELQIQVEYVRGDEYEAALRRVAMDRDYALFTPSEEIPTWVLDSRLVHVVPLQWQGVHSHIFLRAKGPMSERLRRALAMIRESGLVTRWMDEELGKLPVATDTDQPRPLDLPAVMPAFLLLGTGLVLSAVALATEVAVEVVAARLSRAQGCGATAAAAAAGRHSAPYPPPRPQTAAAVSPALALGALTSPVLQSR